MRPIYHHGSGSYRHSVVVSAKTETQNAMNEPVLADSVFLRTRARILTRGAKEIEAANQTHGHRSHRFAVRSNSLSRAVTPKMTLEFDSRTFEVVGAWDLDETRREVVIDCTEQE